MVPGRYLESVILLLDKANTMVQLKPYRCTVCRMYFHIFSRMKQHVKRHKLRYPVNSRKCFPDVSPLKRYIMAHTKEKPYQCEFCRRGFSWQSHLKQHIMTHTKEKPYKCERCQKCFAQISNLRKHIRTHSKEKPYQCEHCQKCFAHRVTLTGHMIRKHTQEKT